MDHLRHILRAAYRLTEMPPVMTERVAAIEAAGPVLARMVARYAGAKNIDMSATTEDTLAAQVGADLYVAIDSGSCDLATLAAYAADVDGLWEAGGTLPPHMRIIDHCIVVALDNFMAPAVYRAVLRGAGQEPRLNYDASGDLIFDRELFVSPLIMLGQLLRGIRPHAPHGVIRWPEISACEAAGETYRGSPVHLLPSAVLERIVPLLRVI